MSKENHENEKPVLFRAVPEMTFEELKAGVIRILERNGIGIKDPGSSPGMGVAPPEVESDISE